MCKKFAPQDNLKTSVLFNLLFSYRWVGYHYNTLEPPARYCRSGQAWVWRVCVSDFFQKMLIFLVYSTLKVTDLCLVLEWNGLACILTTLQGNIWEEGKAKEHLYLFCRLVSEYKHLSSTHSQVYWKEHKYLKGSLVRVASVSRPSSQWKCGTPWPTGRMGEDTAFYQPYSYTRKFM